MKGIITKALAAVCGTSLVAGAGGCWCYHNLVDPCYPERYESQSREEIKESFAPQVYNGHVLEQTIWNYHFETGSDKLTAGGMERLDYLVQRRPCPDPMLYLQTAHDLTYDQAAPEKFIAAHEELDQKRKRAVVNYLNAMTAGRNSSFVVVVHDPPFPGIAAQPTATALGKSNAAAQGVLPQGGGAAGGGAAAAGGH